MRVISALIYCYDSELFMFIFIIKIIILYYYFESQWKMIFSIYFPLCYSKYFILLLLLSIIVLRIRRGEYSEGTWEPSLKTLSVTTFRRTLGGIAY